MKRIFVFIIVPLILLSGVLRSPENLKNPVRLYSSLQNFKSEPPGGTTESLDAESPGAASEDSRISGSEGNAGKVNAGRSEEFDTENPPNRVLVYGSSLLRTMLLLKLSKNIKLFDSAQPFESGDDPRSIAEQYHQSFVPEFQVISSKINQEFLLTQNVDFVVGSWHDAGFGNYVWMIPEYLQELGIGSYASGNAHCEEFGHRFFCEVFHLGNIFHVPELAQKIIREYESKERDAWKTIAEKGDFPSMVIMKGKLQENTSYIASCNNFMVRLFTDRSLPVVCVESSSDRDWDVVSDEFILQRNPHVIIAVGFDGEHLLQGLNGSRMLSLLDAVKYNRVVWLDPHEASSSPDYILGLRKIIQYLDGWEGDNGW